MYAWGGNEYQQCGLVAPEPGAQHQQPSALQGAGDTASTTGTGQGGMLIAAATAVGKASGLTGVAVGHDDTPRGTAAGMDPHLPPCSGQLLHPPERDILVPRRCMPGLVVRQVACGGMNSVVLTDSGEVWTWGEPWGEFALELQRAPRKARCCTAAVLVFLVQYAAVCAPPVSHEEDADGCVRGSICPHATRCMIIRHCNEEACHIRCSCLHTGTRG